MKKINLIVSTFLVNLLLLSLSAPIVTGSENKDTLLKEAQVLYKAGSRYVDARFRNQWEIIYSFQHPEHQKAISFEEFQYFNGHVAPNYRKDKHFQHISGHPTYPSVEDIKRNPIKKDPFLGIPLPPIYRFIPNPIFNFTGRRKFDKVYLDDSGTLGKVAISINVIESTPWLRGTKINRDILYIDYWEKINGKWVLTVMKQFPGLHVSGAVTREHPVPRDMSHWDTAHFTEFDIEDLK